jgi:transposase
MSDKLTCEKVATLIHVCQIQKKHGIAPDTSISGICHAAAISRKTGYEWLGKFGTQQLDKQHDLADMLSTLQRDHEQLQQAHDDLTFEHKGLELAWEIHRVDELLEKKKDISGKKNR